jgi:hypothetical protein
LLISRLEDSKRDPTTTRTNIVDIALVSSVALSFKISNNRSSPDFGRKHGLDKRTTDHPPNRGRAKDEYFYTGDAANA